MQSGLELSLKQLDSILTLKITQIKKKTKKSEHDTYIFLEYISVYHDHLSPS